MATVRICDRCRDPGDDIAPAVGSAGHGLERPIGTRGDGAKPLLTGTVDLCDACLEAMQQAWKAGRE